MVDELKRIQSRLTYRQGIRDRLKQTITEHEARLKEIDEENELYNKVAALLQKVSTFARQQIAEVFEQIVTDALRTILEEPTLQFRVVFFHTKRGTDVKFKLLDTTLKRELNVMKSFGGGVKDIISTILRVMVLELHKPTIHGPIILDETGKNISKEYQENFGLFLKNLSIKLQRQIILVTHSPIIARAAERTIRITKDHSKGVAEIEIE